MYLDHALSLKKTVNKIFLPLHTWVTGSGHPGKHRVEKYKNQNGGFSLVSSKRAS